MIHYWLKLALNQKRSLVPALQQLYYANISTPNFCNNLLATQLSLSKMQRINVFPRDWTAMFQKNFAPTSSFAFQSSKTVMYCSSMLRNLTAGGGLKNGCFNTVFWLLLLSRQQCPGNVKLMSSFARGRKIDPSV